MSDSAFEISKKMFQTSPIGNCGGMHGATYLVDDIGDVRMSEVEILKSPYNLMIKMRIIGKCGSKCGACRRTWNGEWFTVFHFQHLENGESILGLCKSETIPVLLKFNPKETRRGSKIFETEVMFERGNEVVNLRGRWSNDENVIDVNEKVERTTSSVIERCISL